jgi:hypothetical protein
MKRNSFLTALDTVELTAHEKTVIQQRFVNVVHNFENRCFRLALFFHSARFIVTVGSLIVPALLSIQYVDTGPTTNITDPDSFAYRIYWSTWIISLFVSVCNGVLSVFKIEKKYYFLHTTLEQLKSEGWQYIELSGRYSGFHTPALTPNHSNQFVFFCHYVEKIKMKQVEEEYYKLIENHPSDSSAPKQTSADAAIKKDTIIPITPLKPLIEQAKALPPELLDQIVTMAKAEPNNSKENIEKEEKK